MFNCGAAKGLLLETF